MKTYELIYIVTPEITSEEAEAKSKEIELSVQEKKGLILGQSKPLAKTLSYPIKKHASGFVGVIEFQSEPDAIAEIKESLSKDPKITRYMLTIKKPARAKKPSRSNLRAESLEQKEPAKAQQEDSPKTATKEAKEEKPAHTDTDAEKVELKDIEQKLDELLGE